jgi:hypothetical protein
MCWLALLIALLGLGVGCGNGAAGNEQHDEKSFHNQ